MNKSYYNEKSIEYGIAHTRLRKIMELVGQESGRRVLDVGCSRGYVGSKIKTLNNYVLGVDISELAVEEASKVLDKAIAFNLEETWPDLGDKFDLAVLPEIVEHIFDPVAVLKKVNQNLKSNGCVIITTPNILLWTNRVKFLLGNFRYTDQGLMDFGHIRFFTYGYLKEVLKNSGFEIIQENHIIFPGKLTAILKFWPNLFATQFIVKVKKI